MLEKGVRERDQTPGDIVVFFPREVPPHCERFAVEGFGSRRPHGHPCTRHGAYGERDEDRRHTADEHPVPLGELSEPVQGARRSSQDRFVTERLFWGREIFNPQVPAA